MKDLFENIIYSQYPLLQVKSQPKYEKPVLTKWGKLKKGGDNERKFG